MVLAPSSIARKKFATSDAVDQLASDKLRVAYSEGATIRCTDGLIESGQCEL